MRDNCLTSVIIKVNKGDIFGNYSQISIFVSVGGGTFITGNTQQTAQGSVDQSDNFQW